jgi:hypothetical protein
MTYKYTKEGTYQGLLKQPPVTKDHADLLPYKSYTAGLTRIWYHNGCAVENIRWEGPEEIGRFPAFQAYEPRNAAKLSAYVYRIHELLTTLQPITNSDGYHQHNVDGKGKYHYPRFVTVALNDYQLKGEWDRVLTEYFGFVQLAPLFSNEESYGDTSRIGLFGICCTRYIV